MINHLHVKVHLVLNLVTNFNFFCRFFFDIPTYAFKFNDILLMFELLVFHVFKDEVIKLLT
jgi:hypothetical protein